MAAQWTASAVGQMHLKGITGIQLADRLGWHPKYLSAVLNGHRTPSGAEKKVMDAIASFDTPDDTPNEDP